MKLPRRDILLFGALVVAAVTAGVMLWLNRPGGGIDAFASGARARAEASKPHPADAKAFRATVCAASPCVLVEAGGLAFVVGAGDGAEEGLARRGLMRPDLDGVLLTDITLEETAGLPLLAAASFGTERSEPLMVFGPEGVLRVVDGANVMLSAFGSAKLVVGTEGEDQGISGKLVFDSGVVAVRGFAGTAEAPGRVYRFDFEGRSLVVAGCAARPEDIVAAARGTKNVSGVLAAASDELMKAELAGPGRDCLKVEAALQAVEQARLSVVLLAPLYPSIDLPAAPRAWQEVVGGKGGGTVSVATPGSVLDLGGAQPAVRPAN